MCVFIWVVDIVVVADGDDAFTATAYAVLYDAIVLAVAKPMTKNVDKTAMIIIYPNRLLFIHYFTIYISCYVI